MEINLIDLVLDALKGGAGPRPLLAIEDFDDLRDKAGARALLLEELVHLAATADGVVAARFQLAHECLLLVGGLAQVVLLLPVRVHGCDKVVAETHQRKVRRQEAGGFEAAPNVGDEP